MSPLGRLQAGPAVSLSIPRGHVEGHKGLSQLVVRADPPTLEGSSLRWGAVALTQAPDTTLSAPWAPACSRRTQVSWCCVTVLQIPQGTFDGTGHPHLHP